MGSIGGGKSSNSSGAVIPQDLFAPRHMLGQSLMGQAQGMQLGAPQASMGMPAMLASLIGGGSPQDYLSLFTPQGPQVQTPQYNEGFAGQYPLTQFTNQPPSALAQASMPSTGMENDMSTPQKFSPNPANTRAALTAMNAPKGERMSTFKGEMANADSPAGQFLRWQQSRKVKRGVS